jgi:hypothetical protein
MPLIKWCTNSEELKEKLKGIIEFSTKKREMDSELTDETKKALGILWDPVKEEFMFNIKHMKEEVEKKRNYKKNAVQPRFENFRSGWICITSNNESTASDAENMVGTHKMG